MYQVIDEMIIEYGRTGKKLDNDTRKIISLLEKNSTDFYEIVK